MKIRFTDTKLLMPDMSITDGELCTDGDTISFVGEKAPADDYDTVVNGKNCLLMPGFCNAHTHSAMTFLRSYADDLPLDRWLNESVFPREAKLTGEDIYILTKLAVMEYLTSGTTSCFDMYFCPDDFVAALTDCGFRGVLCGSVNDYGGTAQQLEDDFLRFNGRDPLISYRLGFHAEYTTSEKLMKEIAEVAQKHHAPVFTHLAETEKETVECVERHGKTPAAYLADIGMFDHGGGGFHCVWMNEADMDIFAERGLFTVTNPCSNAKLASGIAPLCEMDRKGVRLAIGTDGAASNNALDMFREIYLAAVLQKISTRDAAAMPAKKLLAAATSGSADAMGINAGRLEPGKLADITMIDLDTPNMQPLNSIAENIVYSGSKQNVKLTMVGGKILYRDGEFFIGEQPESIYEKANAVIRRIG